MEEICFPNCVQLWQPVNCKDCLNEKCLINKSDSVCVRVNAELESRGRQSIRIDCGPAGRTLNRVDIVEGLGQDDDDRYDAGVDRGYAEEERNDDESDRIITTSSYDEVTERAVTSANWNSVTSPAPAAETSAAATTASVTSSHHVISDHSSSSSLNDSCECRTVTSETLRHHLASSSSSVTSYTSSSSSFYVLLSLVSYQQSTVDSSQYISSVPSLFF